MSDAITREEKLMEAIATGSPSNIKPITREEMFLAKAGGQDVETPEPITRREKLLKGIIDNGGGGGSSGGGCSTDIGNTITWDGTPTDTSVLVEEGVTLYQITEAVPTEAITTGTMVASIGGSNLPEEVAVVVTDGNVILMQGETSNMACFIALENNATCSLIEGLVLPKKGVWLPCITEEGVNVAAYVSSLTISEGTFVVQNGGGVKPEGTITITENGTHDVTEYASAEVMVSGSGDNQLDALLDGSITEITSNVMSIRSYAFNNCSKLTSVDFPLATSIESYVFYGCSKLTSVYLPLVTSIGSSVFDSCTGLTSVYLPSVTSIGRGVFYGCSKLTSVYLSLVTSIGSNVFYGCSELTSVVLRSETVVTLSNVNAFNNTPFAIGGTGGTVYVPQALIEEYKIATNWSTLYEAGTCTFVAKEGSEYDV